MLLNTLHPMLRRQQLDYGVYVIEQSASSQFNRAMLMNIGFVEAMKRHDYQCTVFHDVDLIPENDLTIYSCSEQPRHLSSAVDKFGYKLPYPQIFGGVSVLSETHFRLVNGFSNLYYGWGGEDDDMFRRISAKGLNVTRYQPQYARYRMISHTRDKDNEDNPFRFSLLETAEDRMDLDGLSSLNYTVLAVKLLDSHTRILVKIPEERPDIFRQNDNYDDDEDIDFQFLRLQNRQFRQAQLSEYGESQLMHSEYDSAESIRMPVPNGGDNFLSARPMLGLTNRGLKMFITIMISIIFLEIGVLVFLLRRVDIRDVLKKYLCNVIYLSR